jgi:competence protein ComEA
MLKKIIAVFAMLVASVAFAAVDVNKATPAELDSVKGIGPVTSKLITTERAKGPFKSWEDFITRTNGIGDNRAAKLSAEGLTVDGTSYKGPAAADKPVTTKIKDGARTAVEKTKETVKEAKDKITGK